MGKEMGGKHDNRVWFDFHFNKGRYRQKNPQNSYASAVIVFTRYLNDF